MNSIKANIITFSLLFCGQSYASFFSTMNAPQPASLVAFQAIETAIKDYRAHNTEQDLNNLYRYMSYFHSWYQSVTPPPAIYFDVLSPDAKRLVANIQETARQFEVAGGSIAGSKRLSGEGENFYRYVLERLLAKLP
ncbi:MAG: hypothetical protein WC707_01840 [Candidatus Babeliaceae bacterium]